MSLINHLSERIVLPVSDLLTNKKVARSLSFLQKSQNWSKEELKNYQNTRLSDLISHAYDYVPYYHDLFIRLNLSPDDIKCKEDLAKLPVLNKSVIKSEGLKRFTSTAIKKRNIVKNSSSGSTGEPLFYFDTKNSFSMNLAVHLRGWYWMGYRLGDKYVKLSQNRRKGLTKNLQDLMSRNFYLATNPLIESNFNYILRKIERYRPKIIRCYPDPLLFLARYKSKHPEFTYSPLAITTTGNTLHPETRSEIESAFRCKIFDAYSCEGNSTVFECPTHSCYHSAEEYGITEILDEHMNNITNGRGLLISTDLWNFAHPFIRYNTQDLVETDDQPCPCGRSHLKINRIFGRDNDIIINKSGRKFIVHNFTGFFQVDSPVINRSVEQFQVIAKKDGSMLFRLVVNKNYNIEVEEYIRLFWQKELESQVIIETVKEIPLLTTGKRKFILTE